MADKKVTGKDAAKNASKVLSSKSTGKDSKTAAGSTLSQTDTPNKTAHLHVVKL